jgi:hypothetical protein
MALKICPTCRVANRGTATKCRCGHVFDAASMVKNKAALRCPLCGLTADGGAASCDCGYDFSSRPEDVRPQLLRRRRYGWFWIGTGFGFVLATGGLWVVGSVLPGFGLAVVGSTMIAKGIHAVSFTRRSLAEVETRAKALPEARLLK